MNGGWWLAGLRPRRRAAHGSTTASTHRSCLHLVPEFQFWRDWSLRHRNDEVRPFLLTLCIGGLNRDRTTSGGSLFCSWSTESSPGEALILSSLPTVVEAAREAFPGLGWARGMAKRRNRRRGAAPRAWSLQQNFEGRRPLFMEILAPDHSWGKVLTILSLTELNPALVREKSRRGWIPFGYEFFPNSVFGVDLGSVALGRDASEAAGPGLGRAKMEKGRGKERLAGPSSASSWVSVHYQIGIRKNPFLFQIFL
jgi:hypothetical protein